MKLGAAARMTRRRAVTLAVLWVAAILLVVIQALVLRHLMQWNRAVIERYRSHDYADLLLVPADWWRFAGVAVPLLLLLTALGLQARWTGHWLRRLSIVGLWAALSLGGLALLVATMGPGRLDSVRLANGRGYVLAVEPTMTDVVYTLYESSGTFSLYWGQIAYLDYSEDGRFVGRERLVLSPDERWLLVSRAGLWTDCFQLQSGRPIDCRGAPQPDWTSPTYEADMRSRSRRIATLTGLAPPQAQEAP